jgi:hypothetical protein
MRGHETVAAGSSLCCPCPEASSQRPCVPCASPGRLAAQVPGATAPLGAAVVAAGWDFSQMRMGRTATPGRRAALPDAWVQCRLPPLAAGRLNSPACGLNAGPSSSLCAAMFAVSSQGPRAVAHALRNQAHRPSATATWQPAIPWYSSGLVVAARPLRPLPALVGLHGQWWGP